MWLGTYTDGPMRLDFYSEDGQFLTGKSKARRNFKNPLGLLRLTKKFVFKRISKFQNWTVPFWPSISTVLFRISAFQRGVRGALISDLNCPFTDVRTESTDLLRYDLWLLDLLETCVNEVQRLGLEEQQRWIGSFPCCPLACLAWVREARRTEGEVRVCRAMFCLGLGKMARPGGGGEQKAAELCRVLDLIRSRGKTMEIIPSLRLVEQGQELHEALAGPVEVLWTSK